MQQKTRHNGLDGLDGAKLETFDLWEDPRKLRSPRDCRLAEMLSLALALRNLQVYFPAWTVPGAANFGILHVCSDIRLPIRLLQCMYAAFRCSA